MRGNTVLLLLGIALTLSCASGWARAHETAAGSEDNPASRVVAGVHVRVTHPPTLETHARLNVQICDAAWQAYADLYSLPLPEMIQVKITLNPKQSLRLHTNGKDSAFLHLAKEEQLLPPGQGGPHNVFYGFCHEMGHIVVYHRMKSTAGMPEGIGEGWAHYFGSVVVSHVYEKLGEKVWTPPYNYHESSGMPRLLKQLSDDQQLQKDPVTRAAKMLYDAKKKFGRKALGQALNKTLAQQPTGEELIPGLIAALVEVTGDASAAQLVPKEVLQEADEATRLKTAFEKLVAADKDWRAEQAAVKELAAIGEKALDVVLQAAEHHEKDRVRRACYRLLTDVFAANERAIGLAAKHGLSDRDSEIRYLCAFRLGDQKVYSAHRRLRFVLNDKDADELTRLAAAKSLAQLGEADVLSAMYDALGSDRYMPRYVANLGLKALTGKDLNDFQGYDFAECAFVSGGNEYIRARHPIEDAERKAKRFQAIAAYCKWLKMERPDLYKHLNRDTF